jgi:hypothetical protein
MNLLKRSAAILAAAILLFTAGCSNNNNSSASTKTPEPSAITTKLQSDMKFPEMIEVKSDRLSKYYSVDADTVKASSVFICSSSASADEIAVFEGNSAADADKIKAAVQKRIDKKSDTFKNYGQPQEYTDIQNCVLEIKGSYVLFAVTSDSDKARQTMESFF